MVVLSQKEWEEPSLKVPRYRALVYTNRLRYTVDTRGNGGYLLSPLLFHWSAWVDRWFLPIVCWVLYTLPAQENESASLSSFISHPLLPQLSTALLTSFQAKKNFKHNLNSKADFFISVEVCSEVWCYKDLRIPLSTVIKDIIPVFIHSTSIC